MTAAGTSIDDTLRVATARLRGALTSGNPLPHVALLLETIARSVPTHGRPAVDVVEDVSGLLHAITPLIAEVVGKSVPHDRVFFGIAAAVALLTVEDDGFHTDRTLYAALLLNDLRSFICRVEIARRGDPLLRAALARYTWEAPAPVDATFH